MLGIKTTCASSNAYITTSGNAHANTSGSSSGFTSDTMGLDNMEKTITIRGRFSRGFIEPLEKLELEEGKEITLIFLLLLLAFTTALSSLPIIGNTTKQ